MLKDRSGWIEESYYGKDRFTENRFSFEEWSAPGIISTGPACHPVWFDSRILWDERCSCSIQDIRFIGRSLYHTRKGIEKCAHNALEKRAAGAEEVPDRPAFETIDPLLEFDRSALITDPVLVRFSDGNILAVGPGLWPCLRGDWNSIPWDILPEGPERNVDAGRLFSPCIGSPCVRRISSFCDTSPDPVTGAAISSERYAEGHLGIGMILYFRNGCGLKFEPAPLGMCRVSCVDEDGKCLKITAEQLKDALCGTGAEKDSGLAASNGSNLFAPDFEEHMKRRTTGYTDCEIECERLTGNGKRLFNRGNLWYISDAKTGKNEEPVRSATDFPCYESAGDFEDGMCRVSTTDIHSQMAGWADETPDPWEYSSGIWGYVNEDGVEVIAPKYLYAGNFCNGTAIVGSGKWVGVGVYRSAYMDYISEGLKWGVIDRLGKEVLPFAFDYIERVGEENCFAVRKGPPEEEGYGLVDGNGKWLVEPTCFRYDCDSYHDGLLVYETYGDQDTDNLKGIYDLRSRKAVLEAIYHDIGIYKDKENGELRIEAIMYRKAWSETIRFDRTGRELERIRKPYAKKVN